jgi:hypothetical protein
VSPPLQRRCMDCLSGPLAICSSTCVPGGPGSTEASGHPADVQLFYYNLGATQIRVQDTTTGEVFCVDFGRCQRTGTEAIHHRRSSHRRREWTGAVYGCASRVGGIASQAVRHSQGGAELGGTCSSLSCRCRIAKLKKTYQCTFGNENQVYLQETITCSILTNLLTRPLLDLHLPLSVSPARLRGHQGGCYFSIIHNLKAKEQVKDNFGRVKPGNKYITSYIPCYIHEAPIFRQYTLSFVIIPLSFLPILCCSQSHS